MSGEVVNNKEGALDPRLLDPPRLHRNPLLVLAPMAVAQVLSRVRLYRVVLARIPTLARCLQVQVDILNSSSNLLRINTNNNSLVGSNPPQTTLDWHVLLVQALELRLTREGMLRMTPLPKTMLVETTLNNNSLLMGSSRPTSSQGLGKLELNNPITQVALPLNRRIRTSIRIRLGLPATAVQSDVNSRSNNNPLNSSRYLRSNTQSDRDHTIVLVEVTFSVKARSITHHPQAIILTRNHNINEHNPLWLLRLRRLLLNLPNNKINSTPPIPMLNPLLPLNNRIVLPNLLPSNPKPFRSRMLILAGP